MGFRECQRLLAPMSGGVGARNRISPAAVLRGKSLCQPLDLRLVASRAGRQVSALDITPSVGFLLQPGKTTSHRSNHLKMYNSVILGIFKEEYCARTRTCSCPQRKHRSFPAPQPRPPFIRFLMLQICLLWIRPVGGTLR